MKIGINEWNKQVKCKVINILNVKTIFFQKKSVKKKLKNILQKNVDKNKKQ